MLGSEKFVILELLLKCQKHLDYWSTIPFRWNEKTQQFVLKSPRTLKHIKIKCFLSLVYMSCYVFQFLHISSKLSLPFQLQCLFYFIFFGVGTYALFHQSNNSKEILGLLNGMLSFESKQDTGKK